MPLLHADELRDWFDDAQARARDLVTDLSDEQRIGPMLHEVNPLLWEIGHVAYFAELFVLRGYLGRGSLFDRADALWDSIHIEHEDRWSLPLPDLEETLGYYEAVRGAVQEVIRTHEQDARLDYLIRYAAFHADMHAEAFAITRQILEYPEPAWPPRTEEAPEAGPCPGDVEVPGGTWMLGARRDAPFVFDNEKWAHPVELKPFRIARAPVTQAEFAAFVDDGGYRARSFWDEQGWAWREEKDAQAPGYWRRGASGWERRRFREWRPLELHRPMLHVNWWEARAWCRWAGRRLPTEAEWEAAALGEPDGAGGLAGVERRFPWGDEPPSPARANLDAVRHDTIDVGALPAGDSAFGCRQMIGNVWEWTDTTFGPYPDFTPDMYADYSQPLFGQTRVLRGGAFLTRARMIRGSWRNYYGPGRRDVWAGFRTCARDEG